MPGTFLYSVIIWFLCSFVSDTLLTTPDYFKQRREWFIWVSMQLISLRFDLIQACFHWYWISSNPCFYFLFFLETCRNCKVENGGAKQQQRLESKWKFLSLFIFFLNEKKWLFWHKGKIRPKNVEIPRQNMYHRF